MYICVSIYNYDNNDNDNDDNSDNDNDDHDHNNDNDQVLHDTAAMSADVLQCLAYAVGRRLKL